MNIVESLPVYGVHFYDVKVMSVLIFNEKQFSYIITVFDML